VKPITIKRGTRACDKKDLGGCGRVIKQGEIAYLQMRSGVKGRRRRFLCKQCYNKKAY